MGCANHALADRERRPGASSLTSFAQVAGAEATSACPLALIGVIRMSRISLGEGLGSYRALQIVSFAKMGPEAGSVRPGCASSLGSEDLGAKLLVPAEGARSIAEGFGLPAAEAIHRVLKGPEGRKAPAAMVSSYSRGPGPTDVA